MSSIGIKNPFNDFAAQRARLQAGSANQFQAQQAQVSQPMQSPFSVTGPAQTSGINFSQRVNQSPTAQQKPVSPEEFAQVAAALNTNYRPLPGGQMGIVGQRLSVDA